MARKAKDLAGRQQFPVENFTNFSFKPDWNPIFKAMIITEFILCGLCVLGAGLWVMLNYRLPFFK